VVLFGDVVSVAVVNGKDGRSSSSQASHFALSINSTLRPVAELEVQPGDFLLSRANTAELVAKSVVVENTQPKLMLSDKVLRLHFPKYVDKWFYNYFNNGQIARAYYAVTASGTSSSMKKFSLET
jgi:type I restriction enzyme S subunit